MVASMIRYALLLLVPVGWPAAVVDAADGWRAGVARRVITPATPMWMSGYASRSKPAEGTLHDLWAKALVLEDADGERAVLVTLDLVGIGRELSQQILGDLKTKYGLEPRQVALCTSHTHTGPVVGRNLGTMYFLDERQGRLVEEYAERLRGQVVETVGRAIASLAPARLEHGLGATTFAVNRRNNREPDVPGLRAEDALVGPVDHSVPVLVVREARRDGKVLAIATGYACHATVLSFYRWSGDWPGFAQIEIEKRFPGATALLWAGCGADQNPLPRRKVELAEKYGRMLADAVSDVVRKPLVPLEPRLRTIRSEINLAYGPLPTREQIERDSKSDNKYVAARARHLLAQLDRDGKLPKSYPYPVQVWRLGDVTFVILGGEVVVDYALRLRDEIEGPVWVAGYSNDVMAYIPSKRVLKEGGYEGGGAMVYYGLPTVWSERVEEQVVEEVKKLVDSNSLNRRDVDVRSP